MSDLISREALLKALEKEENECENIGILPNWFSISGIINRQPIAYDVEYEIRLLKNYINKMPKVYRKRNVNWVIVRDLIMQGTSTAGRTSCITRCHDLGIDPWGYEVKGAVKG